MGHLFNEEVLWKEYCWTAFHCSWWEERKFSSKLIVNFVLGRSRFNLEKADANPLKNLHLNFVKQKDKRGKGVNLVVHGGYLMDLRWGHRRRVGKARVGQWGEMIGVKRSCFDQKKLHVWYIGVTALTGVSCCLQACNRDPRQNWQMKDCVFCVQNCRIWCSVLENSAWPTAGLLWLLSAVSQDLPATWAQLEGFCFPARTLCNSCARGPNSSSSAHLAVPHCSFLFRAAHRKLLRRVFLLIYMIKPVYKEINVCVIPHLTLWVQNLTSSCLGGAFVLIMQT